MSQIWIYNRSGESLLTSNEDANAKLGDWDWACSPADFAPGGEKHGEPPQKPDTSTTEPQDDAEGVEMENFEDDQAPEATEKPKGRRGRPPKNPKPE